MARLSRLVDKEFLEDRIKDVISDFHMAVKAGAIEGGADVLPRMIVDEVYAVLGELDTDDLDDYTPLTYDPEDD